MLPTDDYKLTEIEQLHKDLRDSLDAYHALATSVGLTPEQKDAYDTKHEALRVAIGAYYAKGANPVEGYGVIVGMQKNPTTVEIYAFSLTERKRLYARGLTREEAVFNWNRGKTAIQELVP